MKAPGLDHSTQASDPGDIHLSHDKLKEFHPDLYETKKIMGLFNGLTREQKSWQAHFSEQLLYGDSRAAVVLSTSPLLVAAYTDELDCSVVLRFPANLVERYSLETGDHLLTVNAYEEGASIVGDLSEGPETTGQYCNFSPLIAEFLSEDYGRIEYRKSTIDAAEWDRAERMGREYLERNGGNVRDGSPRSAEIPIK